MGRAKGLRHSLSDSSSAGLLVTNKTRGSGFRRELLLSRYMETPVSDRGLQEPVNHNTWDIPRSSAIKVRSKQYISVLV
jgi:hypothetical protein